METWQRVPSDRLSVSTISMLVLFDIDGTLLRPCGLGQRSLDRAFAELYGRESVFKGMRFHGRTDPEIVGDGLREVGAPESDFHRVVTRYLEHLETEVGETPPAEYPEAVALVQTLAESSGVLQGLVTGNVRAAAELKLGRGPLRGVFEFGAFGDDHADRVQLLRLARERAEQRTEAQEGFDQVIYVGDTERDVTAARDAGVTSVAVATGTMSLEELAGASPDHLLPNLAPERFMEEVVSCQR